VRFECECENQRPLNCKRRDSEGNGSDHAKSFGTGTRNGLKAAGVSRTKRNSV
jgi:hypothetical protein